ncbi:DUF1799 domain-containing protein [Edaphovirga cremea]|uniref:DUF1799 domain-containing protein n=1 Tax=Edaphovirga cremea TaxID=2267246 RepID=UPI000DEF4F41|nr:DUF1799 domain-containing protein [Edaphovirga cremea]
MFPSDYDDVIIEITPDVWPSFLLFRAMSTQWRIGMNGPTGLDYGCLPQVMSMMDIENTAAVFEDIRIMERVALAIIHKRSD